MRAARKWHPHFQRGCNRQGARTENRERGSLAQSSSLNQPSDTALEFAVILGEAIARLHLAGKQAETRNANAPVDSRGVHKCVPLTNGEILEHEDHNTNGFEITGGH